MCDGGDRREAPRFLVTLSARVRDAARTYRTAILDVSTGGLLMIVPKDFVADPGTRLEIEVAMIGTVRVRVVATSERGVHLRIESDADAYGLAVRRVSKIVQSW
ncbi:PilZ domain-containing protein [Methylobacterium sp. J-048]|uniref:PilZ domain-containing protein n=1 Tax=Methylobacterium sp. J-048 TaxID=2836635 RepID=UPI003918E151